MFIGAGIDIGGARSTSLMNLMEDDIVLDMFPIGAIKSKQAKCDIWLFDALNIPPLAITETLSI